MSYLLFYNKYVLLPIFFFYILAPRLSFGALPFYLKIKRKETQKREESGTSPFFPSCPLPTPTGEGGRHRRGGLGDPPLISPP